MEGDHPQGGLANDSQDVSDQARRRRLGSSRTEDDMVRGAFIQRAPSDRMTVEVAYERYLSDVVPSKRPTSQVADHKRSQD